MKKKFLPILMILFSTVFPKNASTQEKFERFPEVKTTSSEIAVFALDFLGNQSANWNNGAPVLVDIPNDIPTEFVNPISLGTRLAIGGLVGSDIMVFQLGINGKLRKNSVLRRSVAYESVEKVKPVQLIVHTLGMQKSDPQFLFLSNLYSKQTDQTPAAVLLSNLKSSDSATKTDFGAAGDLVLTATDIHKDAKSITAHALHKTRHDDLRILVSSTFGTGPTKTTRFFVHGRKTNGKIDTDFDPSGNRELTLPMTKTPNDLKVHSLAKFGETNLAFLTWVEGASFKWSITTSKIDLTRGDTIKSFEPTTIRVSSGLPIVLFAGQVGNQSIVVADIPGAVPGKTLVAKLKPNGGLNTDFNGIGIRVFRRQTTDITIQSIAHGSKNSIYSLKTMSNGGQERIFLSRRDISNARGGLRDPDFNRGRDLEIKWPKTKTVGGLKSITPTDIDLRIATKVEVANQDPILLFVGKTSSIKDLTP